MLGLDDADVIAVKVMAMYAGDDALNVLRSTSPKFQPARKLDAVDIGKALVDVDVYADLEHLRGVPVNTGGSSSTEQPRITASSDRISSLKRRQDSS
jgi:hypothetical protein